MSKVSIIIPAHNAEKTIKYTIESVLKQTYTDYELIVIDDGSTDRTAKTIREITDSRIKLFGYENAGVSVARNRGICQATGEYIAFLDADDLWTRDKLEKQLAVLEANPEAGVAYSRTSFIDTQGNFLYNCDPVSFEGNVLKELLLANFLQNGSNPLIRKTAIETIGEFDSSVNSSEDWDYYLRLAACYPFAVVPKYQILYRRTSNNASSNVERMKYTSYIVLDRAYQKSPQLQRQRCQSSSILHLYCAELYLRNSKTNPHYIHQVGSNLWSSIRLYPQSLLNTNTQRMSLKFLLQRFLLFDRFKKHFLNKL